VGTRHDAALAISGQRPRVLRGTGGGQSGNQGFIGEGNPGVGRRGPIKFTEDEDAWDFEIVMRTADNCNISGCVLASAFFPDAGRHQLRLYPKLFTQSAKEQVETLIHEVGHMFGLRHFFAQVSETAFPSQIFGKHDKFTIMNYGDDSRLTAQDRADLTKLYRTA
jgi:Metallo-peptidase family M12